VWLTVLHILMDVEELMTEKLKNFIITPLKEERMIFLHNSAPF
jgi:hypothetical protein